VVEQIVGKQIVVEQEEVLIVTPKQYNRCLPELEIFLFGHLVDKKAKTVECYSLELESNF